MAVTLLFSRRSTLLGGMLFLLGGDTVSRLSTLNPPRIPKSRLPATNVATREIDVRASGAKGDGRTDDRAAIQAAIERLARAGGGTLRFPAGVYAIRDRIDLASNVHLVGEGPTSVLKVDARSGFAILNATAADIKSVTIEHLGFDGSLNYPATPAVYKQRYPLGNQAINIAGVAVADLVVRHCVFRRIAGRSIHVQSDAARNLAFLDNRFDFGGYTGQAIYVRSASTTVEDDHRRPTHVEIDGNQIATIGPQQYWDPAVEDWLASADAIAIDRCRDFIVSDNDIERSASIGIRVEESISGRIIGNRLSDIGADGISCYKESRDIQIAGNEIRRWGCLPPAYAIRRHRGRLVYATEFPELPTAPLPINPLASDWFAEWPYEVSTIDLAKIISFSPLDYYRGPSAGILPFRGYSAISVNYGSCDCRVTDNLCVADNAMIGRSYLQASDFGFSTTHPTNSSGVGGAGEGTVVSRNSFSGARVRGINAPAYQDPRHRKGALGRVQVDGNLID